MPDQNVNPPDSMLSSKTDSELDELEAIAMTAGHRGNYFDPWHAYCERDGENFPCPAIKPIRDERHRRRG